MFQHACLLAWRSAGRRTVGLLLLQLLALSTPGQKLPAPAARISRGPYLQLGTPTSVVVRWRTPFPTGSAVYYGTDPLRLDRVAASQGRLNEHVVLLPDLHPGTKYYYALGATTNGLPETARSISFRTVPIDGSAPIRVWVLGDPGTGYAVQKAVRDTFLRRMGAQPPSLILALGDNAYRSGTDAQYQKKFFEVYRDQFAHSVVWPALGNHDTRSADSATESGVYFNIFTLPRLGQSGGVPSGTQAYYSFDYGNTHFICLNSCDADLSPGSPMLTWLDRDLAARPGKEWTVAYWHHPPYSKGSHDSDDGKDDDRRMAEMRQQVLPMLEAGGVDLVLCGHSHLYERSFLLHGHYGRSDTLEPAMILDHGDGRPAGSGAYRKARSASSASFGTVYVTAGSAGHATRKGALHGLNHPAMACSLNVPGSFVLDIRGAQLEGVFLDDRGVRRDCFTIDKRP